MADYLLHVEGINHAYYIDDTDDLSTIRGGSRLLLQAMGKVVDQLGALGCPHKAISTGASAGLYKITLADDADPDKLVGTLRKFFAHERPFNHATFAVAIVPATADFEGDRETLIARIRCEQMQAPTFSFSGAIFSSTEVEPCAEDGIRPRMPARYASGLLEHEASLSESVFERRSHGRQQRQWLYAEVLKDYIFQHDVKPWADLKFADEFKHVAEWEDPKATTPPPHRNLRNKLAVLYFDGNAFSRFNQVDSTDKLSKWDCKIKRLRAELLGDLLVEARKCPLWFNEADDADKPGTPTSYFRFETLLWGGDEITWVMPAWKGLWVLDFVLRRTAAWTFGGKPLTHAFGLVFCNSKAPIRRIKALARSLADSGKLALGKRKETTNIASWAVLESFDHAGVDLSTYLGRRYGLDNADLSFTSASGTAEIPDAIELLGCLQGHIDRSTAYVCARLHIDILRATDIPIAEDLAKKTRTQIEKARTDAAAILKDEAVSAFLNAGAYEEINAADPDLRMRAARWMQLVELWDYLRDFNPSARQGAEL